MNLERACIDIPTPTGPMRSLLLRPVESEANPRRRPGLVLYSEIFQITGPIERLAARFAGEGYAVLVPEIYHSDLPPGTVLGYDDAGKDRGNELKKTTKLSTFDADARAAIGALAADPRCTGEVGVVGFCIGGHLAFRAGLNPEVRATCCFYATDLHTGTLGEGERADTLARSDEMKGELALVWGRQDPHIPDAGRRAIYDRVREAGVLFTWHEFEAAHAFMRDEGDRYNPSTARLGMEIALDLFARNLR